MRLPLVTAEFGRNGDGTGSFYGIIARNYLLRHNAATLWMPVLSVGNAASVPTVYAHHPPTVPLLIAASLAILGDTDLAVRLPPLLFTLASIAALYGLLLRTSRFAAAMGAMLLAFVPLSLRFGQMPDVVNSQLVFAALLIVHAYTCWLDTLTSRRFLVLLAALTFGVLTDWPAFYFLPLLGVHLLLTRPRGWLRAGLFLALFATISFGILYLWVSLASHDWLRLIHQFLNRSARAETDDDRAFTFSAWLTGIWHFNRELHTWPLILAGAIGCLAAWFKCRHGDTGQHGGTRRRGAALGVVMLGGWALAHVLVGRQGVLNHDWWWWPVTIALCAGAGYLTSPATPGEASRRPGSGSARLLAPRPLAFVTVTLLCTFWTHLELPHLRSVAYRNSGVAYSPRDLGQACRTAAPPDRAIMLFQEELQPYIVYYAGRPLIQSVWTVEAFERRQSARRADLFYTFDQSIDAPPAAFVIPRVYAGKSASLLAHLRAAYPERDVGQFLIFDLDHPR